ncbi:MAG: TetR/AcrR family transcriptional regulator, partial [Streptosporangiaceae bacterium]
MTTDGRLLRGEQTRRLILDRAMNIASAEGLDGLSIGRLSAELKISKSGLFTHFGSKEELQLATVRAAREVFVAVVIDPVRTAAPGLTRVRALLESWLGYSQQRYFPGGCFLFEVSAEFDARPGRVRDEIAHALDDW